jgi:hypothetical protein
MGPIGFLDIEIYFVLYCFEIFNITESPFKETRVGESVPKLSQMSDLKGWPFSVDSVVSGNVSKCS